MITYFAFGNHNNNDIYKPFYNSRAQVVFGKNEQLSQPPSRGALWGAGPNAAASVTSA